MTEHVKISVITPSFNQGKFIEENIQSVLAENYPNFEHIIVDGDSTDGTIQSESNYHGGKSKEQVQASVPVFVILEGKQGDSSFNNPEKHQPTYQYAGSKTGWNFFEECYEGFHDPNLQNIG